MGTNYLIFSKCILYIGAWYPEEELYQKPSEGIGDKMDHFVNVTSDCQQYVNIGFDQIAHGKCLSENKTNICNFKNNTNSAKGVLGLFYDRMLISCYSHITWNVGFLLIQIKSPRLF